VNEKVRLFKGFLWAALRAAQSAGIEVTLREILRFLTPQGRHVAPMRVKFGMGRRSIKMYKAWLANKTTETEIKYKNYKKIFKSLA